MTVSTEVNENTYTGNGTTTVFPYQFRIFSKSDLVVQVSDLNENVTTLTLDTNYTVSGAGGYRGGSVTLMTPLASGWRISIARELEITQDTDLRNQGKFFAETHEDVFDRLTMLIQQVFRRFGLALRKPSSIADYYDALGNKIRNLGNPIQAQDAATKGYVDSSLNKTLRVPEAFIPELPGSSDRANRLHGYDSLGKPVMLLPESGSAADVLLNLADYAPNKGDKLVAMKQPATGAKPRTVHDKLAEVYSVLDFEGVVGDGVNDDTAGIQAAIDATPYGGMLYISCPSVYYKISSELVISKPILITGFGGSSITSRQFPCLKASGHNSIFKLRATLDNFMFGAYGITGVHLRDLFLEGPALNTTGLYGICTDETVNGGIYHVRNNTFTNVNMRYFDNGWNIRGICYLNSWNDCRALWCGRGCVVDKVAGATEGGSDQNRFFGCEFVMNDRGLSLSEAGYAGSQTIVGCTLSEGLVGLIVGFNTTLHISGCQIENNQYSGINITIPSGVNPNSEAVKNIIGNCFILNGNDIFIDKLDTSFTSGFSFPVNIEGNTFSQTTGLVLYVNGPTGPGEFDSRQFRLSSTNAYSPLGGGNIGLIPDSKISSGWKGYNGFHEDGKVTATGRVIGNVAKNILRFDVPAGKQCFIKYDMSSLPDDASSGTTPVSAGIRFTNVTGSAVLLETFGTTGTLLIPRVSSAMTVVVALWSNTSTNSASAIVSYCVL